MRTLIFSLMLSSFLSINASAQQTVSSTSSVTVANSVFSFNSASNGRGPIGNESSTNIAGIPRDIQMMIPTGTLPNQPFPYTLNINAQQVLDNNRDEHLIFNLELHNLPPIKINEEHYQLMFFVDGVPSKTLPGSRFTKQGQVVSFVLTELPNPKPVVVEDPSYPPYSGIVVSFHGRSA